MFAATTVSIDQGVRREFSVPFRGGVRVAKRVREGGHNIPETVVRRRYARGLANLFELYIPIVDTTCVFDGAAFPPIVNLEQTERLSLLTVDKSARTSS
jgi:predicted ABC-type ATPase